jgi:hypothetical protein
MVERTFSHEFHADYAHPCVRTCFTCVTIQRGCVCGPSASGLYGASDTVRLRRPNQALAVLTNQKAREKGAGDDHYRGAHEDRQAAVRFAFRNAGVDCVTVGYKNTAEIDEAIENLNLALA